MAKHCRMRALVTASLLSIQIGLLSAQPHTSQHLTEEWENLHLAGSKSLLTEELENLAGGESLSRQTRESHHLSRPSPDPHRLVSRSRGPPSPRPSRAFRQPPTAVQSSQSQPPAERRTFITVLLAAEVAYLEGILASSLLEKAQKEERKKKRQAQAHQAQVVHQHPAPSRQPYAQQAPPVTEKYVSQLDPFFMLDAPDLSAGGPSQGYEVGPNQRIEIEEEAESGYQLIHQAAPASSPAEPTYDPPSPRPTYGAFPVYAGPAEAPKIVTTTTTRPPVLLEDYNHPTPAPRKRLVRGHSRGNWGDFELYHPGGYLPTQPRKQRELSKKEKGRLVVKKEFKAAPARAELKEKKKKEGKRTTAKKEQQVEYNLVYRPSPAVVPPSPSSPISILRGSPSTKASTAYRGGNSPPITTYKPVVHRVKSTAAVSRPRPDSTIPSKRPRTSAVPSKRPRTGAGVSKKARTGATTPTRVSGASVPKSSRPFAESSVGSKRQKTAAPNLHPHTFFHEDQAKQVHKGEWPANYYNSIHNQQIKVRRI